MSKFRRIAKRPIVLPPGFRAAGIAAGLKPSGAKDMALIAAERAVPCAGVFTQSTIQAAPVKYSRKRLKTAGTARAVFTNSGTANAATGKRGLADTEAIARSVGTALQCAPGEVLVCSTGVIGPRVNVRGITDHVSALADQLDRAAFNDAAQAIQTTDTKQKDVCLKLKLGDTPVTLVGMAKGAAMIAPNMATMLAFLMTDAAVEPKALQRALDAAVRDTFNCISVDGDTSTNDTVLLFASGAAGNRPLRAKSPGFADFQAAVHAACADLARQIVLDAEGATKLVELDIVGAPNAEAARHIGLTIAGSPLVKTAIFGADPNYGRLLMAIGRSGVPVNEEHLTLKCGRFVLVKDGEVQRFDAAAAAKYLQSSVVSFQVTVGRGKGSARILTCDLTYDYVRLNAEYTT